MPAERGPSGTGGGHYKDSVTFTQRSLLRPWRVERIVQRWTGRKWIVVSRTRVSRG